MERWLSQRRDTYKKIKKEREGHPQRKTENCFQVLHKIERNLLSVLFKSLFVQQELVTGQIK